MTKKEIVDKNLDLLLEFMKYAFDNPEILDQIPREAELVILPEDDPKLLKENLKTIEKLQKSNKTIAIIRMKAPQATISKVEIISV